MRTIILKRTAQGNHKLPKKMEQITLQVYDTEGKEIETITLDSFVFDGRINASVVYQAVNAYLANQRKGLAATKTRGEVSGGGRKPWQQKGTGRARVGSTRSPLWRHGGVVFGPHPRDYSYKLPVKIKELALKSSLNSKIKENNLLVLDNLKVEPPKTKTAVKIFSNLKINIKKPGNGNILLLLEKRENNFKLSLRNIGFLNVNLAKQTFAYEILRAKKLVITKGGLLELSRRFKKESLGELNDKSV